PAPPAPGVAGERERRAAEPGHEGDSRCAASGRAGAHEAARGGAGRLRTALRRAGGPDGTGRLPGRALRHACGLVRSSGDALPLPGPGADRGRRRALRGDPSALSPVRQDELPAGPARRAAGRGRRDEKAALLHAGAASGARPRGRGLLDRADPCPPPHLEGRRRASLCPARGSGRGALHASAQARLLHAALRGRVRGPTRCASGGGLMNAAATLDLEGMLRRLHLPTVRRLYAELARRAEEEGMSYRDYLATLAAEEIAHRAQTCPGTPRFAQLGDTYFCAPPGSEFLDFSSSLGRGRSTRGLGFEKASELAEAVAAPVDVDQVDVVEQPVEDRRGEDLVTGEDLGPVAHVLVAGQDDRAFLVAGAHE